MTVVFSCQGQVFPSALMFQTEVVDKTVSGSCFNVKQTPLWYLCVCVLLPDTSTAVKIPCDQYICVLSHPFIFRMCLSRSPSNGEEGTVVAAGRTHTAALLNLVPCRWQAPSPWRRVTFFPTGRHIVADSPHARRPGTRQQARVTSKRGELTAAACRPCCPSPVCNQY